MASIPTNQNQPPINPTTNPQNQYYDNQDIFKLNFSQLYDYFITPIDNLRSHYNAISPNQNSQELNTPQYQESRCHTFFRMIGFPIVDEDGGFHSPGFDPNLNTDSSGITSNAQIDQLIVSDTDLKSQLNNRELLVYNYRNVFLNGGLLAQAAALGSIYIRSFANQFSDTDPLVLDPNQTQTISERITEIFQFYSYQFQQSDILSSEFTNNLTSVHLLKPFIVDPRIDAAIHPATNRICAPFLRDKTQTKIFNDPTSAASYLSRPYIENVITTRFNNQNVTQLAGSAFINQILADIRSDGNITDPDILSITSNALAGLYSSELVIFDNYFKIMRIILDQLVMSIRLIQRYQGVINFDPIPDTQNGVEAGTNGGALAALDPNDPNNQDIENDIILLTQKKYLNDINFTTGLQGVPDPGDFVFSNLNDIVYSVNKNIQKSYDDNIAKATDIRMQLGNEGITALQNIEIVMGEFSGLGLIDIVAIQAALWIMPANSLLGLIDARAFTRIGNYRKNNINLNGASQNPVLQSLTDFEATLKIIYLLIQDYYDSVNNGTAYTAP
jgi:hypothetical protein